MENLFITGGKRLEGSIDIDTAKNAILPILAGSILYEGKVIIHKVSPFTDVMYMVDILKSLGCETTIDNDTFCIDSISANNFFIPEEFTKKIRSSIFMLGPLLSRFKFAKVAYPGGCNIGNRPIDLHLKGLHSLNVIIQEKYGYIFCDGRNMVAGEVHLDFPSVGATENLIMASIFLKGTTTIHNVAREPEICDLQNFINAMGGNVRGAGSDTITIIGVHKLHSCEYTPISDRIIAGTFMVACAITGGSIKLNNSKKEHNLALISKLKSVGVEIISKRNSLIIKSNGRLKALESIETQPYPGFPTDLQSQILSLQTLSIGTSVITENLFETRFKMCTELVKMGGDITIKNRMAIVKGVEKLYGTKVCACDLRGGAGLVLAGLSAEGVTTIEDIYHIDRGYLFIEKNLASLNAEIKRK